MHQRSERENASALGSIAGSYVSVEAIPDEPTQEEHEKRFEENVRSEHFHDIMKLGGGTFKNEADVRQEQQSKSKSRRKSRQQSPMRLAQHSSLETSQESGKRAMSAAKSRLVKQVEGTFDFRKMTDKQISNVLAQRFSDLHDRQRLDNSFLDYVAKAGGVAQSPLPSVGLSPLGERNAHGLTTRNQILQLLKHQHEREQVIHQRHKYDASAPLQSRNAKVAAMTQASALDGDYAKMLDSSPLSLRKRHRELQRGSVQRLENSRGKKSELILSEAEKELKKIKKNILKSELASAAKQG